MTIVLPGVSGETADWAARRAGRTTTFQHSSNDSKSDAFDSQHMAETGRDLIDAYSVNHMLSHHQSLAFLRDVPPIRLSFPPNQKEVDAFPVQQRDFIEFGSRPQRRRVPHEWALPPDDDRGMDFFNQPERVANSPAASVQITNSPDIWQLDSLTRAQGEFQGFQAQTRDGYYRPIADFDPSSE